MIACLKKLIAELRKKHYGNNTNFPVALPSPVELSGCSPLQDGCQRLQVLSFGHGLLQVSVRQDALFRG